jgi:hypothetical protein
MKWQKLIGGLIALHFAWQDCLVGILFSVSWSIEDTSNMLFQCSEKILIPFVIKKAILLCKLLMI